MAKQQQRIMFKQILNQMANQQPPSDTNKTVIINQGKRNPTLRIQGDILCFNVCESRCFFYVRGLSELHNHIPEIKPDDVVLLVVLMSNFNPAHFFDKDCKYFIHDFNTLPGDDVAFIHDLHQCPHDTGGVGFTILQQKPRTQRAGSKPRRNRQRKPFYRIQKKQNSFEFTTDSMWFRTLSGIDYDLRNICFQLRIAEYPSWLLDVTPVLSKHEETQE